MEPLFLQFGFAGATLGAMVVIVGKFMKNSETQTTAFLQHNKDMSESFKNTIDNHIQHDTESKVELKEAVEQNSKVIEKLLEKLT